MAAVPEWRAVRRLFDRHTTARMQWVFMALTAIFGGFVASTAREELALRRGALVCGLLLTALVALGTLIGDHAAWKRLRLRQWLPHQPRAYARMIYQMRVNAAAPGVLPAVVLLAVMFRGAPLVALQILLLSLLLARVLYVIVGWLHVALPLVVLALVVFVQMFPGSTPNLLARFQHAGCAALGPTSLLAAACLTFLLAVAVAGTARLPRLGNGAGRHIVGLALWGLALVGVVAFAFTTHLPVRSPGTVTLGLLALVGSVPVALGILYLTVVAIARLNGLHLSTEGWVNFSGSPREERTWRLLWRGRWFHVRMSPVWAALLVVATTAWAFHVTPVYRMLLLEVLVPVALHLCSVPFIYRGVGALRGEFLRVGQGASLPVDRGARERLILRAGLHVLSGGAILAFMAGFLLPVTPAPGIAWAVLLVYLNLTLLPLCYEYPVFREPGRLCQLFVALASFAGFGVLYGVLVMHAPAWLLPEETLRAADGRDSLSALWMFLWFFSSVFVIQVHLFLLARRRADYRPLRPLGRPRMRSITPRKDDWLTRHLRNAENERIRRRSMRGRV